MDLCDPPRGKEQTLGTGGMFVAVLTTATALVYFQVLDFRFVGWDDGPYVYNNPTVVGGITLAGLKAAWTSVVNMHWHPLTVLSHMLDVELFGMNPGAHHATSVAVHLLNSLLLFSLLNATTKAFGPSAFVAAAFALHPMHVQNVAWIAGRKDLLCTFFGLLALHAYVRFVRSRGLAWYGLLMGLYGAAFLCKSMMVTLPLLCFLLDRWPLNRYRWGCEADRSDMKGEGHVQDKGRTPPPLMGWGHFMEKLPLLIMGIVFIAVTCVLKERSGWLEYYGRVDLSGRVINAVCSYAWYILKTLWPTRLAAQYIHPNLPGGAPWMAWQIMAAVLLLAGVSAWVWRARGRKPFLLVGWLWYLGTLAPVSGLMQFSNASREVRFMYVPMIGLLMILAWSMTEWLAATRHRESLKRRMVVGSALIGLVLLGVGAWGHCRDWRHTGSLYAHQLRLDPTNPYFNANMAILCGEKGDYEAGIRYAKQALAVWPKVYEAHQALERIYRSRGQTEMATHHRAEWQKSKSEMRQEHDEFLASQ